MSKCSFNSVTSNTLLEVIWKSIKLFFFNHGRQIDFKTTLCVYCVYWAYIQIDVKYSYLLARSQSFFSLFKNWILPWILRQTKSYQWHCHFWSVENFFVFDFKFNDTRDTVVLFLICWFAVCRLYSIFSFFFLMFILQNDLGTGYGVALLTSLFGKYSNNPMLSSIGPDIQI